MFRHISLFLLALALLAPQAGYCAPLSIVENIAAIEALPAPAGGSFTFVVLGDSREGDKVYRALLKQALSYQPAFILHTGDMVSRGTVEEYRHYVKLIDDIPVPVVHVAGNHDIRSGRAVYEQWFGPFNWSFDFGGCRFLGLDNPGGTFGKREFEFAQAHLDAGVPTFALYHKPPPFGRWTVHSMESDGSGGRGTEMHNLLKKYGVKTVFLGHIHLYDALTYDGIDYFISGGSGAGLYGQFDFGKAEYGLLVVRVKQGQAQCEWVRLAAGKSSS